MRVGGPIGIAPKGPPEALVEELERVDDVREGALDGGAEQGQRGDDGDRDDAEDDGVLGHRLAGLVLHGLNGLIQGVGQSGSFRDDEGKTPP